jgi:hypothetical protein
VEDFFALARAAPEGATARARATAARQAGYGGPQVMRDYLYLRVRRNEPWGWVYWNLGATSILNLHDGSASVLPEITYTGIPNLELRSLGYMVNEYTKILPSGAMPTQPLKRPVRDCGL